MADKPGDDVVENRAAAYSRQLFLFSVQHVPALDK